MILSLDWEEDFKALSEIGPKYEEYTNQVAAW